MHYFLNISDAEIAEHLNIARNTSYRNRMKSLNEMRKILEEEKN
jgi:DNA-directed RNA polymerase specialized sigma24 family protein